jgi:hypothetical protein
MSAFQKTGVRVGPPPRLRRVGFWFLNELGRGAAIKIAFGDQTTHCLDCTNSM